MESSVDIPEKRGCLFQVALPHKQDIARPLMKYLSDDETDYDSYRAYLEREYERGNPR